MKYLLRTLLVISTITTVLSCGGDKAIPVVSEKTSNASNGEYQMDFYLDEIAPGNGASITCGLGFIFIKDGNLYYNDQYMKTGSFFSVNNKDIVISDNSGANLWRWDITPAGTNTRSLNGANVKLPEGVKESNFSEMMSSTLQISNQFGPLTDFIRNGKVLVRFEKFVLEGDKIYSSVTRKGPSMSAMMSGNIKSKTSFFEDTYDTAGNNWTEHANYPTHLITYAPTEFLTLSLLPGDIPSGQIIPVESLMSKSTGEPKGTQTLIMDQYINIQN